MSIYSTNVRSVACKLIKLEAPDPNNGCDFGCIHLVHIMAGALSEEFACKRKYINTYIIYIHNYIYLRLMNGTGT